MDPDQTVLQNVKRLCCYSIKLQQKIFSPVFLVPIFLSFTTVYIFNYFQLYFPLLVLKYLQQLTLCIPMDFPIHIDTISMGVPIIYFKGSQVDFSKIMMYFCP